MRKFGKESTAPAEGDDRTSGFGWLQNHCALVVIAIAVLALVLRTVFVYGVSAADNFALSGGIDAQYHLHVVESMLNGSYIMAADAAVNYPVGGLNVHPPLYDFIAMAIASFSSASFGLAVLAPIFGTLTVFPVYFLAKELKDEKVGVIAALIYALMALPISASVFSNGTEYTFAAFLFTVFCLFLVKVVRKVNDDELAIKEIVLAGIMLGVIALAWNGVRAFFVMLILIMVIQIVLDRFNNKDFKVPLFTYSLVLIIGLAIGAAYYIPAGLWDAVFSGTVLITVIAVAFGFIFKALETKPWIFTIPGLVLAFAVISIALFFAAPQLCSAMLIGNTVYTNEIFNSLASLGVSLSQMASYYGWLLMWMPIILGIYQLYKYAMKERTHRKLAYTMWLIIPWLFAWGSYGAAVAMGCVFAISSAIIIVKVLTKADLKAYWTSMRNAGFPGFFRKMIKPLPFISVIVAVCLVIVPGCIYAVDAGISSNEDYGYFAYGNTSFTVQAGDDYPYSYIYDDLERMDGIGAVVTWIEYADGVAASGYPAVNHYNGEGASAVAHLYLSNGSAGATAAQLVRLMYANTDISFASAFGSYSEICDVVTGYIAEPKTAVEAVLADTSVYGNINSDIKAENAIYFASIHEITENMSTADIMRTYESAMSLTGDRIGYYVVDGSMLPLVYGDGDSLSTIAEFAGYSTDSYGAATQFYSLITYYSNYYPAMATDALYDTFLWKALIGPSATDLADTNSFSLLADLSASDGKIKAMPGSGLAGYTIASWFIKYNPDARATTSSDGWEYKTYEEAMDLQAKNGGVVNYLSSIILYQYVGVGSSTMSAKVVDDSGVGIPGITVEVSSFNSVYGANTVYSETTTGSDGTFTAQVPSGVYTLTYKSGNVKLESTVEGGIVTIKNAKFAANIFVGDAVDRETNYMYILKKDSKQIFIQCESGVCNSDNAVDSNGDSVRIVPGSYTYELRDSTAATVGSGSVTLYAGENPSLRISPTNYKLTATVTDFFGNSVASGKMVATNSDNGEAFAFDVVNGEGVVYLPNASYTVSMTDGYVTLNTTSLTMSQDRTVSVTAYPADLMNVNESDVILSVNGGGFSSAVVGGKAYVPTSIGATTYAYTVYGADANSVYYGVYTGSNVNVTKATAYKVSGSIGTSGMVDFILGEAVFSAVASSAGSFEMMLPSGSYIVYAHTDDGKVYIGKETISGDVALERFDMSSGRTVDVTYNYDSSSSKGQVGLPFAVTKLVFTYESQVYTLTGITGTDGSVSFVIPKDATDAAVGINGGSINNKCFKSSSLNATIDDGSENVKKTITIGSDDVLVQTVTANYQMTLTPYGGEEEIAFNRSAQLAPGSYTAEINATTGHYFKGVVYVYPGQTTFSGLNVIDVYGVEITKRDIDELTITGDKTHNNYNGGDVYYFEYDCDYYLESSCASTGYINHGFVSVPAGTTGPSKIDMSTRALVKVVDGYVGAAGNGTVVACYDNARVEAEVDNGAFTMELPNDVKDVTFFAEVTKEVNGNKYGFSGSATVKDIDSGIVNIPVVSASGVVDYTKDSLDAFILNAEFNSGKATISIRIFNNTDTAKAYAVTAGPAWNLDQAAQVTIAANTADVVTVNGSYDPQGTGIGSMGMSVIVSDFNGSDSITLNIVDGFVAESAANVTMKTASESDNKDKLSGSEYMYALTFVNSGDAVLMPINATVASGYSVKLMNADGSVIRDADAMFVIPAQSSAVIYAKVMSLSGNMSVAPSVTIHSDAVGGGRTINASSITVEVDSMTVSGDTVVDEKSGVPMGVWFIFGVCILLLVLIVWMGSKRGVFSRK